jgi:microcompartment protein CcmK/EutM
LDENGKASGGYLIAVAAVDAGVGQRVLVLDEGNGARQILGDSQAPVRSVVVGVVDSVDLD